VGQKWGKKEETCPAPYAEMGVKTLNGSFYLWPLSFLSWKIHVVIMSNTPQSLDNGSGWLRWVLFITLKL
jgi:hypothetical protein